MRKYFISTIKELLIPIIILVLISIASIFLFIWQPFNGEWQGSIFSNIGTETLGVLITIIFLDAYITSREQNKKNERQCSFLKTLRQPVLRHLSLLSNIYKATRQEEGNKGKISVSDFFNDDYYSHIILLDLAKPAPVFPEMKWCHYLATEVKKYFDELDNFLDKYSFEMDLECLQMIENIKSNSWLNLQLHLGNPAINFGDILPIFYPTNDPNDQKIKGMKGYHELLVIFITYINLKFDDEHKIVINATWSTNIAPNIGSGRLDEEYLRNNPRII